MPLGATVVLPLDGHRGVAELVLQGRGQAATLDLRVGNADAVVAAVLVTANVGAEVAARADHDATMSGMRPCNSGQDTPATAWPVAIARPPCQQEALAERQVDDKATSRPAADRAGQKQAPTA